MQIVPYACFGLSSLLAFALEVARLRWPWPSLRAAAVAAGVAGLVAQSAFLLFRHLTPADPDGALLAVAWVLAVFTLYGTVHHGRRAWAVFGLPVVLGLSGLAMLRVSAPHDATDLTLPPWVAGDRFWGAVHGVLLLGAAVGVSVGFLASVMYLVQARRLRAKANPLGGLSLLSLERLEAMNRRAVNAAFPLLTAGLLLGAVLLKQYHEPAERWRSVKVLGTVGLWGAFAVLLYLRYAAHVPGRRLAALTIGTFALLVVVLAAAHPFAPEAGR